MIVAIAIVSIGSLRGITSGDQRPRMIGRPALDGAYGRTGSAHGEQLAENEIKVPSQLASPSELTDVEMDVLVFVLVFTVVDDSVLLVVNSVLVVDDSVVVDASELDIDEFTSVLVSSPNRSTIVVIDSSKVSCSQSSVSQSPTDVDWALPAPIMTLTPTATTTSTSQANRVLGIRCICTYYDWTIFLIRVLNKIFRGVLRRS